MIKDDTWYGRNYSSSMVAASSLLRSDSPVDEAAPATIIPANNGTGFAAELWPAVGMAAAPPMLWKVLPLAVPGGCAVAVADQNEADAVPLTVAASPELEVVANPVVLALGLSPVGIGNQEDAV
jgi:hypothetical protein